MREPLEGYSGFLGRGAILGLQKLSNGGAPILTLFLAGYLCTPAEIASLSYKLTIAVSVLMISDFGVNRLLTREAAQSGPSSDIDSLGWVFIIRMFIALTFWALIVIWPFHAQPYLRSFPTHLYCLMSWSVLGTVSMAVYGWALGNDRLGYLGSRVLLGVGVQTIGWIVAVIDRTDAAKWLLLGLATGRLIEIGSFLTDAKLREALGGQFVTGLRCCRRGVFLVAQQVTSMVYSRLTVIVVSGVLMEREFGTFSLIRALYSAMALLPSSLAHSSFPDIARKAVDQDGTSPLEQTQHTMRRVLVLHGPLCLTVATLIMVLPERVVPPLIWDNRAVAALASLGSILVVGTTQIGYLYLAQGFEGPLFKLSVGNALVSVALVYILSSHMGLFGAVVAVLVTDLMTIVVFAGAHPYLIKRQHS